MRTVNLYEAKNQLSKLIAAAEEGEIVIVARNGKPAAKLVPLHYGETQTWSPVVLAHLQTPEPYDPDAFVVDRSDLADLPERDLF